MNLCKYCIEELKSRGDKLLVGDLFATCEESERYNMPCNWCGEYDDIFHTASVYIDIVGGAK